MLVDSMLMAQNSSLPDSNEFDDRFYSLIGQIVVTFNSLEALLRECVAGPLGPNTDLGVVVLCRTSFSDLVDMFRVTSCFACNSRPDSGELVERICRLAKDLKASNDKRNGIVHCHYGDVVEIGADAGGDMYEERMLTRTKFKRELNHALYPYLASARVDSLAELESALEQIKKAYSDLDSFSSHLVTPWWSNLDPE
jgi:hypothetical protein